MYTLHAPQASLLCLLVAVWLGASRALVAAAFAVRCGWNEQIMLLLEADVGVYQLNK